jgi:hypothetical protein
MNPLSIDDIANIEADLGKWTRTLQAAEGAGELP